jgi:hypothetical protein
VTGDYPASAAALDRHVRAAPHVEDGA